MVISKELKEYLEKLVDERISIKLLKLESRVIELEAKLRDLKVDLQIHKEGENI